MPRADAQSSAQDVVGRRCVCVHRQWRKESGDCVWATAGCYVVEEGEKIHLSLFYCFSALLINLSACQSQISMRNSWQVLVGNCWPSQVADSLRSISRLPIIVWGLVWRICLLLRARCVRMYFWFDSHYTIISETPDWDKKWEVGHFLWLVWLNLKPHYL